MAVPLGVSGAAPEHWCWRQRCGCQGEEPVPEARREEVAWREHSGGAQRRGTAAGHSSVMLTVRGGPQAWKVGSGRREPIPGGVGPAHGERSQARDVWGTWLAQGPLARALGFPGPPWQATPSCRHPTHAGSLLLGLWSVIENPSQGPRATTV